MKIHEIEGWWKLVICRGAGACMNFYVKVHLRNVHDFQNGTEMEIHMAFLMEISWFVVFIFRNFVFSLAYSIFYILSK